eukprot:COSAG02_NODE_3206_length_7170_cov_202.156272_8_plen_100_part_00
MHILLERQHRVSPPEISAYAFMIVHRLFGKGLYFANAVGKSAAYCQMTEDGDYGVLALLEVALGDHHMCKKSFNRVSARGYHSGTEGRGAHVGCWTAVP